jgi:serine/threonine-protein phosphatase PGAM5
MFDKFFVHLWLALLFIATPAFAVDETPVRTLYLVRHGAYLPDRNVDPSIGPSISPLGIAQARLTASRFRSMPVAIESVTSSTMTRARETAAIIHEQVGDAKSSASALISECTPPAAFPLNENEHSLKSCKQRLDSAFDQFFKPARGASSHEILVAHGNVIRYLVTRALGVEPRMWTGMSVAHASLTIVEIHGNGSLRVVAIGDTGHIPANLQSWGDESDPNLVKPDVRGFVEGR